MRSSSYRARGFSYISLMLVVALLGVGLAIAGESYSLASRRDREQELLFVGSQFRAALRSYHLSTLRAGQREFPATLEDLLQDNRFPGTRRHLRRIYLDPMTGKAEWGLVTAGGRIVGVHSLSEAVPIKQANFESADAALEGAKSYREWVFAYRPEDAIAELGASAGEGVPLQPQPPPAVTMPGQTP